MTSKTKSVWSTADRFSRSCHETEAGVRIILKTVDAKGSCGGKHTASCVAIVDLPMQPVPYTRITRGTR
jgi:hypothetical protein